MNTTEILSLNVKNTIYQNTIYVFKRLQTNIFSEKNTYFNVCITFKKKHNHDHPNEIRIV